jgi:putative endonuclease
MVRSREREVRESVGRQGGDRIPTAEVGRRGETLAVALLKKKGYSIIDRNYRCQLGEVDVVALDGKTVCFVEVKTRRSNRYDRPEMAVHKRKQQKLSKVAHWFLRDKNMQNVSVRFDVIAIQKRGDLHEVRHLENAFECLD